MFEERKLTEQCSGTCWLTVLIEGSQRALRIRTQGRSTARGVLPAWIAAATDLSVQIIEGSSVLQVAGPTLFEAAPEAFRQAQLFPEVDPGRPAIDYLIETLDAAVDGADRSALYDGQLLEFLRKLGKWPGEETDEQIGEALDLLS